MKQDRTNTTTSEMNQLAISQTKAWLDEVVIGLNFCPFAKKEFVNNTIAYAVSAHSQLKLALEEVALQFELLAHDAEIETSLLIFTDGYLQFERFLDLVDYSNDLLIDLGFEGIFQLANFHPDYFFEGEPLDSASHYTNRSPYPTLHFIREKSMERALNHYPNPELIPENNIALTQEKGCDYFEQILKRIKR
ncbi:DUF1415 domain-containing protein [Thalassotalea atypica]|uniref:DUF1415 domain-containing protein n=1 Tax=Thalassotalea atypica TaxID=2054316 RepID=UPI002573DA94|nr:DUF1415 domain-containing protein [Thalassotalea atypica]